LSKYKIPHGNAVAIGMSIMTRAAVRKNVCSPECVVVLERLLAMHKLPLKCDFSPEEICKAALNDKKRNAEIITEVIPKKIGECVLRQLPVSSLLDWVEAGIRVRERDLT
jgi:3-dehydroquinate synthase